jgi:hypothetical protein
MNCGCCYYSFLYYLYQIYSSITSNFIVKNDASTCSLSAMYLLQQYLLVIRQIRWVGPISFVVVYCYMGHEGEDSKFEEGWMSVPA